MDYNGVREVYDTVLKIVILIWPDFFLKFIGIDEKVEEVLKTEFVTVYGKKVLVDYLCRLKNGNLLHIEFEYPSAFNYELERFHFYNCVIRDKYDGMLETFVFNFSSKKKVLKSKIGQGIYFCPPFFNLADVNFDDYLDKINIKVNTNKKLSGEEEIVLMLRCLVPSFRKKASFLKEISKLLDKKELFDEFRFQYFEAIVLLEIHNVIPEDDGREIMEKIGEIKMTPQAQTLVNKVVTEVNDKILYETREEGIQEGMERGMEKGREEGIQEGIEKGMEKGKEEAAVEIAKNFKDVLSDEDIAIRTNLPLDVVRKL